MSTCETTLRVREEIAGAFKVFISVIKAENEKNGVPWGDEDASLETRTNEALREWVEEARLAFIKLTDPLGEEK